jgi:excisionase family DNA binding protein
MTDPSSLPISSDAQPPGPNPKGAPLPGPKLPAGQPAASGNRTKPREKYITAKEFRYRIYEAYGHLPAMSTLYGWLEEAKISAVRIGHLWLIPESAWEEFLKFSQQGLRF